MRDGGREEDEERARRELRIIRRRVEDLERRLYRKSRDVTPPAVLVGQVFDDGAMPTTTPAYFAVRPVAIGGVEAEGSSGVFAVSSAKAVFLVLGSEVPDVGDKLIARAIDGRWVAERGGATEEFPTQPHVDCPCPDVPTTLFLTFSRQVPGLFEDATLVYGPAPTGWITDNIMYSTLTNPTGLMWWSEIHDRGVPFPSDPNVQFFRYGFSCHSEPGTRGDFVQSVWMIPKGGNFSQFMPTNVGFMHENPLNSLTPMIGIGDFLFGDPPATCSPIWSQTTLSSHDSVTAASPGPQVFTFSSNPAGTPLVPPVVLTLSS